MINLKKMLGFNTSSIKTGNLLNNNGYGYLVTDSDIFSSHGSSFQKWLFDNGYVLNFGGIAIKDNTEEQIYQLCQSWDKSFKVAFNFFSIKKISFLINNDMFIYINNHEMAIYCKSIDDFANVQLLLQKLSEFLILRQSDDIEITYFYEKQGVLATQYITLSKTDQTHIYPELYPTVDINILNNNFRDSREKILILYGDPGVGKTTFIKHMLYTGFYKTIGYIKDTNAMKNGEFWAMASSTNYDLLIFDDLDNALGPRENNDDNSFINNLLSYSDGIITKSCKVVITTNQPIERIDSALIRPGRCFDFLVLPSLTAEQAEDIWLNVLKMNKSDFDIKFNNMNEITQAALMAECNAIAAQRQCRSYVKNGDQYYSIGQKIKNIGIMSDAESAGFTRR